MNWRVEYLPEAQKDIRDLDGSQRILVRKAIQKVSGNPLSSAEGGYGTPLGSKGGTNLTGFLKIKLKGIGLRIVYKTIQTEDTMLIVIIGARADDEVYEEANHRVKKHSL